MLLKEYLPYVGCSLQSGNNFISLYGSSTKLSVIMSFKQ